MQIFHCDEAQKTPMIFFGFFVFMNEEKKSSRIRNTTTIKQPEVKHIHHAKREKYGLHPT